VLVRDYERTEQAVVLESRGMGFRNARPLRPRPTPPVRSSHIVKAEDSRPWATMFLQDVYQGLRPHDREGGIDLTGGRTDYFNVSYEVLARRNQGRTGSPLVNRIPTYNGVEWNILEITPKAWGSAQSKLAELILSGHPDEKGKPRVAMDEASRRRVLMWIDLNVPYYGTAYTAHPNLPACRQLLPADLGRVMDDVYARRCQKCHEEKNVRTPMTWRGPKWSGGRGPWGGMGVRIENPELNDFLLAPLAKSAGGTGRCGQPVFRSKDDPDYQAVLKTFDPVHELMRQTPRMDMPGAVPADCCPRMELTAR